MCIRDRTYGKRELRIKVVGNNARKLLNQIAYEMEKVNDRYHFDDKIQAYRLLPCSCLVCQKEKEPHFHKYSELIVQKRKGWDKVPCGKTGDPANVDTMLSMIIEGDEKRLFAKGLEISYLDSISQGVSMTNSKPVSYTHLTLPTICSV